MKHLNGINVSNFDFIEPSKIFKPDSVESIRELIIEYKDKTSSSLRVISTGYNWGLGSASYIGGESDLICLNQLNKIREINLDLGYAIIEAGVTQEQLSKILKNTNRFLNCTASTAFSSIVGNMMDRGVGLHGQRTDDLLGIEVILADGTLGNIGWWPEGQSLAQNPWGLGPSSLHLFTQSSLGIVTAATIRLRPRPSHRTVVSLTVEGDSMRYIIDRIRSLTCDEVLSGVTKIYDSESSSIYGSKDARIVIHACIDGTVAITEAKIKELMNELAPVNPIRISEYEVDADPLMSAVKDLYYGDTSGNENIVQNALNTNTKNADTEGKGWIFVLPFIPMRSNDVLKGIDIARKCVTNTNIRVGTTINVLNYDTVDLVIALSFQRIEPIIKEAHKSFEKLVKELVKEGYSPYRVDSCHTRNDYHVSYNGLDAKLASMIKTIIDPNEIFTFGRYIQRPGSL